MTKKWLVETRVTQRRQYFVEAENEKEAETKSCDASSFHEEDENEETMSITEVIDAEPLDAP